MSKHILGVTYLSEKEGTAEIDEELAIQRAIGETLRTFSVRFVVVPEDLMNEKMVALLRAQEGEVYD